MSWVLAPQAATVPSSCDCPEHPPPHPLRPQRSLHVAAVVLCRAHIQLRVDFFVSETECLQTSYKASEDLRPSSSLAGMVPFSRDLWSSTGNVLEGRFMGRDGRIWWIGGSGYPRCHDMRHLSLRMRGFRHEGEAGKRQTGNSKMGLESWRPASLLFNDQSAVDRKAMQACRLGLSAQVMVQVGPGGDL